MNKSEIIIYGTALIGVIGAVIAFIRTPKDQRFVGRAKKEDGENYAPEYTKKEKITLILKQAAWALPLYVGIKIWIFPWFEVYVSKAHCYNYGGGITGIHLVFYGVCVGIPFVFALTFFAFEGFRSIKVIQLGQNPLPNEKVFRSVKYSYGLKAKIKPYIFLALILFLVGLSVRGIFWAKDIIDLPRHNENLVCVDS